MLGIPHYVAATRKLSDGSPETHIIGEVLDETSIKQPVSDWTLSLIPVRGFDPRTLPATPKIKDFSTNWRRNGLLELSMALPAQPKAIKTFQHVSENWKLDWFESAKKEWEKVLACLEEYDKSQPVLPKPADGDPVETCSGCGTGYLLPGATAWPRDPICMMCDLHADPFKHRPVNIVSEQNWDAALKKFGYVRPKQTCRRCGRDWPETNEFCSTQYGVCALCDTSCYPHMLNPVNRYQVERWLDFEQKEALGL